MYGRRISYIDTGYTYSKNALYLEGIFYGCTKTAPQENGFANVTPPDVVGVVCVNNSPPKAKHWLLSRVTRWKKPETKPWLGESVDRRTLKDVVELWFKLHGKSLTAGQHVYDKLLLMVDALGDPLATDLTSKMFAHYRDKRLTGEIYFSEKWKKRSKPGHH